MVKSQIIDGGGNGYKARVTSIGQLVTGPAAYDLTQFVKIETDNTAFNFYGPQAGKQFVITGIRIKADRSVSTTVDALVVIYESDLDTSLTEDRVLHEEALVRGESATLFPLNILVNKGKYINGKTTDNNAYVTITGYYINEIT